MDMITERTVHVTGATIEDYDVSIGEGAIEPPLRGAGAEAGPDSPDPHAAGAASFRPCPHAAATRRLPGVGHRDPRRRSGQDDRGRQRHLAAARRRGLHTLRRRGGRRRRRRHGSGRFRGRHMDARRAVRQSPHVAARHGGRLYGRQDRHQHAAGQEPRRVVLHACRRARRPQDTRLAAQRHLHRRAGRGRQIGIHQGPRNPAHP